MPFRGSISAKGKILAPTPFLSLPRQREEELAVHQEQQRSWIVQERIGIAANTTSSALMERAHPTVDRVSTPAAKGLPALAEKISPSSNPQAKLSKVTSWSDQNLEACVVESGVHPALGHLSFISFIKTNKLSQQTVALFVKDPPRTLRERPAAAPTIRRGAGETWRRALLGPVFFIIVRLLDLDSYVSGLVSHTSRREGHPKARSFIGPVRHGAQSIRACPPAPT